MPDKLVRITIRIPKPLQQRIEEVRLRRGPRVRQVDLWREAAWKLINEEEDVIGSRAHFQKSLREKMDAQTERLQSTIPLITNDEVNLELAPKFNELKEQITLLTYIALSAMMQDAAAWSNLLPNFTNQKLSVGEILKGAFLAAHNQEENLRQLIERILSEQGSA